MSPLKVEAFNSSRNEWVRVGEVMPEDPRGSMSNNTSDGKRDLVYFECAKDDSGSIISRAPLGIDIEIGRRFRQSLDLQKPEVLRRLRDGESYEMGIKTDVSGEPHKIRFTHAKGIYKAGDIDPS